MQNIINNKSFDRDNSGIRGNSSISSHEGFDGIRKGNARLIFSILIGIILLNAVINFIN